MKFLVTPEATAEGVLSQNRDWVQSLQSDNKARLMKEVEDLAENGAMIFQQGGSFNSTRTINLEGNQVVIFADFTKPTLLQKVLALIGLR